MAELLIRPGTADIALLDGVLRGAPERRPHRLVLDAHTAQEPRLSVAARRAGVPLLIDPQTHYLQGTQHLADPWAQLPFADRQPHTPASLSAPGCLEALAAAAVTYQLDHHATAVIAPYVHIERADTGWVEVQVELWRATRRFLDREQIELPVLAVLALGWRELDRACWPAGFAPLRASLRHDLRPDEVALAASRVDAGVRPAERLANYLAVIGRLRRRWPVLAWQQGTLGEAAVAAGAAGYECGIGWRERCDLQTQMRSHAHPRGDGGSARPVYLDALGRSLPRRSIEVIISEPRVSAQITCLDPGCCPHGSQALLADARAHAIAARRRSLTALTRPDQPAWRWNVLADKSAHGLDLAERINRIAARTPGMATVSTSALGATLALADHRRQATRRRAA